MSVQTAIAPRPLLRGYLHLIAAVVSPYALVYLVLASDSGKSRVLPQILATLNRTRRGVDVRTDRSGHVRRRKSQRRIPPHLTRKLGDFVAGARR